MTSAPNRPFITAKWAQTLDGRAAAADGSSQWITGAEARADVHRRRAAADAILVGTGTVLADDPSLTARTPAGELLVPSQEQPVPVVVGRREIPSGAKLLEHPRLGHPLGTSGTPVAEPIRLTGDDLAADLEHLKALGIHSVFVEGGPTIVSALIRAGLVDEVLVYVAPALLGGPRLALNDIGANSIADIRRLHVTETLQLGADLLIRATTVVPKEER
ncbi:RibD family protein [Leucobacter denitrificans]|uniref:RibD family protein n=1 Tax=Leucobacter denitrificans TaxID=683042 RepID=UPI0031B58D1A